jgi:hypothetical protein
MPSNRRAYIEQVPCDYRRSGGNSESGKGFSQDQMHKLRVNSKGQLLANGNTPAFDELKRTLLKQCMWPVQTVIQPLLHATFKDTKKLLKNSMLSKSMKVEDANEVKFGSFTVDERHLCEFNSVDRIY